jgi:hypothetical protein
MSASQTSGPASTFVTPTPLTAPPPTARPARNRGVAHLVPARAARAAPSRAVPVGSLQARPRDLDASPRLVSADLRAVRLHAGPAVRAAYGLRDIVRIGIDGTNQTIAIVDVDAGAGCHWLRGQPRPRLHARGGPADHGVGAGRPVASRPQLMGRADPRRQGHTRHRAAPPSWPRPRRASSSRRRPTASACTSPRATTATTATTSVIRPLLSRPRRTW